MTPKLKLVLAATLAVFASTAQGNSELREGPSLNGIIDEGMNHSQVMATAAWLTDRIGARLTNSPQMREAQQWTQARFVEWGLTDVHAEAFDFGRGWSIDHASARMLSPRVLPLTTIPIAWTPATDGPIRAGIVVAPLADPRDFDRWQGKLRGKIVLVTQPEAAPPSTELPFKRLTDDELRQLDVFEAPEHDHGEFARSVERRLFAERLDAFLAAEGAIAWVRMSRRDGLVHGDIGAGAGFQVGHTRRVPGVEMAANDYLRLARLAGSGASVTLELDVAVRFHDEDHNAYNIIANVAGRDAKAGYVMAGAHLDSWVAADGAVDNGAGVAVVMEAARILAKLGVKPKRTIRFALWAAEEQGGLGSLAYIERHLAVRPAQTVPGAAHAWGWSTRFPVQPRPGFSQLAGYFNLDAGSGRIRGIHAENNFDVMPIFREWLAPFASMGASTVVVQSLGGSDHVDFQSLGLPAFQFIQEPLDYFSRLHHSNLDTYDHLVSGELRQNAVILAAILLMAAERDAALPRKPLPTPPADTDPFTPVNPPGSRSDE